MSPAPSPKVRQVAAGFAIVLFGLGCLAYGRQWRFVFISPSTTEALGLAIVLLGVLLRFLAFKEIPCTHRIDRLVTSGIYSKTRNPVYLSFIIIVLGISIFSERSLTALWIVESVLVFYWVAKREESDLESKFGEEYRTYKRNVPRFIPRLTLQRIEYAV
jgi:protein-S-isoprenylcysteine O-methyltransferase Ste14